MSDEELLALLETKTPEELTPAEIEILRSRLSESPAVRNALLTQVRLEGHLHEALGPIEISAAEVAGQARSQRGRLMGLLALILVAVLVTLGGLAAIMAGRQGNRVVADVPDQGSAKSQEAAPGETGAAPAVEADPPSQGDDQAGAHEDEAAAGSPQPPVAEPKDSPPAPAGGDQEPAPPADNRPPPWQAALDMGGDPPPFREVAFDSPWVTSPTLHEELTQWFAVAEGSSFRFGETNTRDGRAGTIEGVGRLLAPWLKNSALRLHLENFNRLQIHFFHKERGVSLVYYEDMGFRWGGYVTTREPKQAKPSSWQLTATDDGRGQRTQLRFGGPIELRYHDGEVILSRGDIVLVSAPLDGPPTEVYFDGRATVLNVQLLRTLGVPALPPRGSVVYESDRPAELPWTARQPEIAELQAQPDGGVRFAADKAPQRVDCYAPLPLTGLHEVIVQLADVSPGAGFFLGRAEGKPHEVLRFYRDRRSGQLAARTRGWDDEWEADFDSPSEKLSPLVQPELWVRMIFGCGNLRWWVSSDGRHWAQPEATHEPAMPELTSIGLQIVANRPETRITLKRLILRRLDGLHGLADEDLVEQAPAVLTASSPGTWLLEVLQRKPAGVASDAWLRACSLRALAAGAHRDLAYPLLEALLDDAARRGLPLEQQLAALDDALLVCADLRDEQRMQRGVLTRYAELGMRASDTQELGAWSTIRPHYLSAAINTALQHPLDLDALIRDELIRAAHNRVPQEALALSRALRTFQLHRDRPLVDWVESRARRAGPRQPAGELAPLKDSWREPLVEELSKDGYNVLTELQAVLESQAWEDAARIVTGIDAESASGVAPYLNDKELLVSLPVAIRLTLQDYPELRQSLGDRFAALAQLRLGQGMAAGDSSAIELTAVQFAGTPAAAEAHRWLGDRALASGWFQQAMAEYTKAQTIEPSLSTDLQPRLRLAAAMLGTDFQSPVTRPVQIGELQLSPAEFEALVAEMRSRPQQAELSAVAAERVAVPEPSGFESHVRSRLDGPAGEKPGEEVGRRTNQYRVPWVDRQIATVVEGNILYVTNRFQVAAYNLDNGQRLWQSQPPPGNMQRAQDWAMIPMRPLVTADRIYARMLYSANPLLVCLEKSSGKLLWLAQTREGEHLVSDPVIVRGQLIALAIALQPDQQGMLRWCSFDPHTGELLKQRDLVRLRSTWGSRSCCQVVPLDDGLVAALGGITLTADTAGVVRWIRSHVALPADEDPRWVLQMYQPPLVSDGRAFTAQPGMRTVECLAIETGRRHWSTVLPDVVGVVGLVDQTLVVRTESGLRGMEAAGGNTVWHFAANDLHSFQLLDDKRLLVAHRERHPTQKDRWQTRLTWLDPHSGQPRGTTVPPSLEDNDPRLGPLVPYNGRLFAFFGRGQHDPHRDFVELIPQGEAARTIEPTPIEPWLARVPAAVARPTAELLGPWQLLSGQAGDRTGLLDDAHGERHVLGVRSNGAWPIVLAREVTLPDQGRPRLRLRVARDGGQHWKLEVRHGDVLLSAQEIKDETHSERWQTVEVDLASAAGNSGWLTVQAQAHNGDHVLYVRSAEISF